jgi:hypothetical protein
MSYYAAGPSGSRGFAAQLACSRFAITRDFVGERL